MAPPSGSHLLQTLPLASCPRASSQVRGLVPHTSLPPFSLHRCVLGSPDASSVERAACLVVAGAILLRLGIGPVSDVDGDVAGMWNRELRLYGEVRPYTLRVCWHVLQKPRCFGLCLCGLFLSLPVALSMRCTSVSVVASVA